jgi:hypothetical protein
MRWEVESAKRESVDRAMVADILIGDLMTTVPCTPVVLMRDIRGWPHNRLGKRTSLALSISAASKRPTSYSITSSAATRRFCGTVRPSVLAILRLMTNSNLVDCMTGSSAGFSPLRIRPV